MRQCTDGSLSALVMFDWKRGNSWSRSNAFGMPRFHPPSFATHLLLPKDSTRMRPRLSQRAWWPTWTRSVCALRQHDDGLRDAGTRRGTRAEGAAAHLHQGCSADPPKELPELSSSRPRGAVRAGHLRASAQAVLRHRRGCWRADDAAVEAGRGVWAEAEARSFADPRSRRRARRLGRRRRSSGRGERQPHSHHFLGRLDAGNP